MNDKCNKFLPSFSLFDKEFSLEKRLIDSFLDHFSFHMWKQDIKGHLHDLDNITISVSTDLHSIIVISDASIRNNVATFILHIHSYNRLIIKMIHHTINITSTEAELFAIKYRINQANNISNVKHIVSKSLTVDFIFILSFHCILVFFFFFGTTRVRVYQSCSHIGHKWITRLEGME